MTSGLACLFASLLVLRTRKNLRGSRRTDSCDCNPSNNAGRHIYQSAAEGAGSAQIILELTGVAPHVSLVRVNVALPVDHHLTAVTLVGDRVDASGECAGESKRGINRPRPISISWPTTMPTHKHAAVRVLGEAFLLEITKSETSCPRRRSSSYRPTHPRLRGGQAIAKLLVWALQLDIFRGYSGASFAAILLSNSTSARSPSRSR
jgi:hypothetical protein